jgi:Ferritin-like
MPAYRIETLDDLHEYLYSAMQLEHATIPPYLTALYSLHPGSNPDAAHVLRVVAVEEMLHLTLVANLLNAVGGEPDLTRPDFVPDYPTALPDGETDFTVSRQAFHRECVETFLKIERPGEAPRDDKRLVSRAAPGHGTPAKHVYRFYSIGEFYEEVRRGIDRLYKEKGDALFSGPVERQVTPEYYYSGGGELIPVTDIDSARAAIRLISEQGEGLRGGIYNAEHELSHYYRFEQLLLGRFYEKDDEPGKPTGPPLHVDWAAVYPLKKNAKLEDFPEQSELRAAAERFNQRYADFLALLTAAFNGSPALLVDAVAEMLRLRDGMLQLIRNTIPGEAGVNGAPTYQVAGLAARAAA